MKRICSLLTVICMLLSLHAAAMNLEVAATSNDSVLDPNFQYMEPTFVMFPDSIAPEEEEEQKEEEKEKTEGYTFIYNNIRVTVTKGEIDTVDGTYEVTKGGKITFTATKPFKNLLINGSVKAYFSATTDKGQIEAMYPDVETTDNPVVMVKNINDTSVTITCNQKLECIYTRIYFYSDPQETIHGRTAPGMDYVVNCNNMMAEYNPQIYYDPVQDTVVVKHGYKLYMSYNNGIDSAYTVSFSIIAEQKGVLEGKYSYRENNLIPEESFCTYSFLPTDFSTGVDGVLTIHTISAEEIFVSGYLICKNNNLYYFDCKSKLPIVDPTQGIEYQSVSTDGRMFDILGRPVGEGYKGFVIRDGKKYIVY